MSIWFSYFVHLQPQTSRKTTGLNFAEKNSVQVFSSKIGFYLKRKLIWWKFDQSFLHPIDGKDRSATAPLVFFCISSTSNVWKMCSCFAFCFAVIILSSHAVVTQFSARSSFLILHFCGCFGWSVKFFEAVISVQFATNKWVYAVLVRIVIYFYFTDSII